VHFLPESVLRKVWGVFDQAGEHYGMAWPVQYRTGEAERLARLRSLGARAVPSLAYAHKPGMARWLNDWCAEFAARVPDAVHSATFFPEASAATDVRGALAAGARLFKLHVQVGGFSPLDPLLEEPWSVLEEAGVPTVLHAGSAPRPGEHTGPAPVAEVLRRHPGLVLVIAHLGMSEYHAFADLAEAYDGVHLDTTMAGTDFTERFAPLPPGYLPRLAALRDKVVLGSDFPNIPYAYAHQIEALDRWELGDDWLRAVLWQNGNRLMGLEGH
jgi:predicted TIM-barrel fold metal-dependent hydrolase